MELKIGSIVGNWKVVSERYKIGKVWFNDCECICGKIVSVRNWHLTHSLTMSCGCKNDKGRFKSKCIGNLSSSYFTSFKASRKSKGLNFEEDVDMLYLWELFQIQNEKCAISGVEISLNPRWSEQNKGRKTAIIQTASLDRIDNSKGYTKENIQWVHKDVNFMKGNMDDNVFIFFCKKIYERNKDKLIEDTDTINTKRKFFSKHFKKYE